LTKKWLFQNRGKLGVSKILLQLVGENGGDPPYRIYKYCENRNHEHAYQLPKVSHDGIGYLSFTPDEFLNKLAMLIPPKKKHLHHYHGAFAPNAPLRKSISSHTNKTLFEPPRSRLSKMAEKTQKASLTWAELIKRIYEDDPLKCPFGHKMKITGFVTNPVSIKNILLKMGLPTVSPELEEGVDWEVC
jgi:hypothetical protein